MKQRKINKINKINTEIEKNKIFRMIPTMIFQNNVVRFHVSLIGSGEYKYIIHFLKCILVLSISQTDWEQSSDISFDIF